jgi:predicted RNA binding protein YcfA (HicA-like mRNA interferase family)
VPSTVRQMIKPVEEADGWYQVMQSPAFKHPSKPGRVTIAGKLSEDVHPRTERSIRRQAGLIGGQR